MDPARLRSKFMSPFVGGFQKVPSCMYTRLHEYSTARKQEAKDMENPVLWKLLRHDFERSTHPDTSHSQGSATFDHASVNPMGSFHVPPASSYGSGQLIVMPTPICHIEGTG